jgi:hypothetical protein
MEEHIAALKATTLTLHHDVVLAGTRRGPAPEVNSVQRIRRLRPGSLHVSIKNVLGLGFGYRATMLSA